MLFPEKHDAIDFLSHDPIIFCHMIQLYSCAHRTLKSYALDVDEPQIGTIAIDCSYLQLINLSPC